MPAAHERKPMNFIERWLVKIALAATASASSSIRPTLRWRGGGLRAMRRC